MFSGGHVLLETTPRVDPYDAEVNSATTNVVSAAIDALTVGGMGLFHFLLLRLFLLPPRRRGAVTIVS